MLIWEPSTRDVYNKITYVSGEIITARWEDKRERFLSPRGEELIARAVVHVDQNLLEGGFLYLGTSTQASPKDQAESYMIRAFEEDRGLRGVLTVRKALL